MTGGSPFSYTWTPARPTARGFSTSRTEVVHLTIAFVVLTFDLVLLLSGAGALFGYGAKALEGVSVGLVVVAALAALTGFVGHELAHKLSAQRKGYWAEFRMSPFGLVISVVSSALGVLWAAPGATVISQMSIADRREWGRTSLAGPLANVAFGSVFLAATLLAFRFGSSLYGWLMLLTWFNAWFAAFNLLPFGPLDGAKVLRWSPAAWFVSILLIGAFAAYATLVLYGFVSPFLGA